MRATERGFTFIELMVAMAISMVLAVMTYGGFRQVQGVSAAASEASGRLGDLQMAMRRIDSDLIQSTPRPVRDPLGDSRRPALLGDSSQQYRLELSRGGWSNPLGRPRSTQERVAYFLDEDRLIRRHWLVMDATVAMEPIDTVLLDGVADFEIRFMDSKREWLPQWPPLGSESGSALRTRPLAIEITLDVNGFGRLVRQLEVRG